MKWDQAKKILLEDREYQRLSSAVDLNYEISKMIIDARIAKGLTQHDLAIELGTKQPAIARMESGKYTPSFNLLNRLAAVFNTQLLPPRFEFQESTPTYILTASNYWPIAETVEISDTQSRTKSINIPSAFPLNFEMETTHV